MSGILSDNARFESEGLGDQSSGIEGGYDFKGSFGNRGELIKGDILKRSLIIPDLHGDDIGLKDVLHLNGFTDEKDRWIGGDSRLVFLGDLINRGRRSRELLDYLIDLFDQIIESGGKMECLYGNHEMFLMNALYGDFNEDLSVRSGIKGLQNYGERFLEQFGLSRYSSISSIRSVFLDNTRNQKYVEFLNRFKVFYSFGDFLFVHGGVSKKWAEKIWNDGIDKLNESFEDSKRKGIFYEYNLAGIRSESFANGSEASPMWYTFKEMERLSDNDGRDIADRVTNKGYNYLVCGHDKSFMPRTTTLKASWGDDSLKVVCLDTTMTSGYDYPGSGMGGMLITDYESGLQSIQVYDRNGGSYDILGNSF